MERTLGVLGGMGPEATAEFFQNVIRLTPARGDQDHLKVLIVSNPKIPDRTAFLTGVGESPLPLLLDSAAALQKIGADFIAIPCNTAHAFWKEISEHVQIPVLHIVDETVEKIVGELTAGGPGLRIGVLATRGTIRFRLYQTGLEKRGLVPVLPGESCQRKVSESISLVKAGMTLDQAASLLEGAVQQLARQGVDGVILGCTELGLVSIDAPVPLFDSLKILAESSVRFARGKPA